MFLRTNSYICKIILDRNIFVKILKTRTKHFFNKNIKNAKKCALYHLCDEMRANLNVDCFICTLAIFGLVLIRYMIVFMEFGYNI